MRSILIALAVLFLAVPAYADPVLDASENNVIGGIWERIPEMKNAVTIDKDGDIGYAAMFGVVNWKGVNLDVGYSPEDVLLFGLSYDLFALKDLGVNVPILDLVNVRPGIMYGFGRIEGEDLRSSNEKLGIYVNLIDFRF